MGITRRSTRSTPRADGERGAALVEMALVMPILLLLIVGIWTTARAWNIHNVMDHAVREAARYGATIDPWDEGTSTDACASASSSQQLLRCVVDEQLQAASIDTDLVSTACIELDTNPCSVGDASGNEKVAVSIVYPGYTIDFIFFSATVDLTATAVSRFES